MGSVNQPKFYDPTVMVNIKAAFHDVYAILEEDDNLYADGATELEAAIIRKLIDLVADGTTNANELKAEVLKTLPLG